MMKISFMANKIFYKLFSPFLKITAGKYQLEGDPTSLLQFIWLRKSMTNRQVRSIQH